MWQHRSEPDRDSTPAIAGAVLQGRETLDRSEVATLRRLLANTAAADPYDTGSQNRVGTIIAQFATPPPRHGW